MKCQALLSQKRKQEMKKIRMSPAAVLICAVKVKKVSCDLYLNKYGMLETGLL